MTNYSERPKIYFTVDEIEEFLEDEVGYKIVQDEQFDSGRWDSHHWFVVERLEDGTFWGANYTQGLTEGQHRDRYERWGINSWGNDTRDTEKVEFRQVFAKTVTSTVYE
jgi:hypothetical protein